MLVERRFFNFHVGETRVKVIGLLSRIKHGWFNPFELKYLSTYNVLINDSAVHEYKMKTS